MPAAFNFWLTPRYLAQGRSVGGGSTCAYAAIALVLAYYVMAVQAAELRPNSSRSRQHRKHRYFAFNLSCL